MVSGLNYISNDLSKYGLNSSGNIQADLAAIKAAKQAKGESTLDIDNFATMLKKIGQDSGKKYKMKKPEGIEPPYTDLMQSLGLQLQGSREADFAAIQSKITQLESSTDLTTEQKASLTTLKSQFEKMKKMEKNHHKGRRIGNEGQKPQGPPQGEPPWFSLLKTLGLQPQGSKEADFAAMETKIAQMQSTTLPAEQKANLESLKAQLEQYKLQAK